MDKKEKAKKILDILKKEFPDAKTALNFSGPLTLLVATILSARCTDTIVNKTTPALFKRYKTAKDYAEAGIPELSSLIGSINFYKNKAKSIKACCKKIAEDFGGKVPETIEELTRLPGVGRKTANIVLGSAFKKPALAVDTHVKRVAKRLGLTDSDDPDRVEEDLCKIIPQNMWTETGNLFIMHGRKTCKAKNPLCEACPLKEYSDYYRTAFRK